MTCKTCPTTHTCECGRRIRGNAYYIHKKACTGKMGGVRCFVATVDGFSECYIPAETPGAARYIALKGLRDAGYTDSAQFQNIHISHAKSYDYWAATAKPGCYTHDALPAPDWRK